MKTIVLIRHAKSDWAAGLEDHKRPLSPRGLTDAPKVAAQAGALAGDKPVIYSSTAKRAMQTAIIFSNSWGVTTGEITFADALYTFDHSRLEAFIATLADTLDKVFIFGHNEAITDFVNKFGNIYIDNVPTAGLVELLLPTDSWRKIVRGSTGTVIFPKDLKHGQHDL